jgi:hypothetical protein
MALAGQRFQLERAPLAARAHRDRHRRGAGRILLGQRVPFAAGVALALPAIIRRAAVLADEGEGGFGHVETSALLRVRQAQSLRGMFRELPKVVTA